MASADYAYHFSTRNIPFGIGSLWPHEKPQAVTRVWDTVIFLHDVQRDGFFSNVEGLEDGIFLHPTLNRFAALPRSVHRSVRKAISESWDHVRAQDFPDTAVSSIEYVRMYLPVEVGDFVGG